MKRLLLVLLACLTLLAVPSLAETAPVSEEMGMDWQENDPWFFLIYHGDREIHQVAITMDDCYETEYVKNAWELVSAYGGAMTFYPVGTMLKDDALGPGDREMWQAIAASSSEIGTHTHHHLRMPEQNEYNMMLYSKYPQHVTDALLGYHYPLRTLRPPYGDFNALCQQQLKVSGYSHVILWDVDSTDPEEVLSQAQNGSILLFHARHKDYACLEIVVPDLVNRGYELVTVSEMLHLPPLAPDDELFNWSEKKSLYFD